MRKRERVRPSVRARVQKDPPEARRKLRTEEIAIIGALFVFLLLALLCFFKVICPEIKCPPGTYFCAHCPEKCCLPGGYCLICPEGSKPCPPGINCPSGCCVNGVCNVGFATPAGFFVPRNAALCLAKIECPTGVCVGDCCCWQCTANITPCATECCASDGKTCIGVCPEGTGAGCGEGLLGPNCCDEFGNPIYGGTRCKCENELCDKNETCCSRVCINNRCACLPGGSDCTLNAQCCSGNCTFFNGQGKCVDVCKGKLAEICPYGCCVIDGEQACLMPDGTCCKNPEQCSPEKPCCPGFGCVDGECKPCKDFTCFGGVEICDCPFGCGCAGAGLTCTWCINPVQCNETARCCCGYDCEDGRCTPKCVNPVDCSRTPCCPGYGCVDGKCRPCNEFTCINLEVCDCPRDCGCAGEGLPCTACKNPEKCNATHKCCCGYDCVDEKCAPRCVNPDKCDPLAGITCCPGYGCFNGECKPCTDFTCTSLEVCDCPSGCGCAGAGIRCATCINPPVCNEINKCCCGYECKDGKCEPKCANPPECSPEKPCCPGYGCLNKKCVPCENFVCASTEVCNCPPGCGCPGTNKACTSCINPPICDEINKCCCGYTCIGGVCTPQCPSAGMSDCDNDGFVECYLIGGERECFRGRCQAGGTNCPINYSDCNNDSICECYTGDGSYVCCGGSCRVTLEIPVLPGVTPPITPPPITPTPPCRLIGQSCTATEQCCTPEGQGILPEAFPPGSTKIVCNSTGYCSWCVPDYGDCAGHSDCCSGICVGGRCCPAGAWVCYIKINYPCIPDDPYAQCVPGAVCDPITKKCVQAS